ncbi:hypothetical protein V6N13_046510 [Hibiscus sabdariffa]|uniref:Uncharacterized protein n=1 Tax=Hibiscus sabdariffa TaxID=183260 RepID=A0ABR2NZD4_9ROSI
MAPPNCPVQIYINKPLPANGFRAPAVGIGYGNPTGIVNVFQALGGNFPVGIANTYQAPAGNVTPNLLDDPQAPDSKKKLF